MDLGGDGSVDLNIQVAGANAVSANDLILNAAVVTAAATSAAPTEASHQADAAADISSVAPTPYDIHRHYIESVAHDDMMFA